MKLTLLHSDREYQVEISSGTRVRVGDRVFELARDTSGKVTVDGNDAWVASRDHVRWVFWKGEVYEFAERRPAATRRGGGHQSALTAPMPATVRRILVAPGDAVKPGDSLLILEAMKMELPVRAGAAGTVRAVRCREGELVQPGIPLVEIE